MTTDWQSKGLCRDEDPAIFFVEPGQSADKARAICVRCPVTDECREWALATDERFGVWGGTTDAERKGATPLTMRTCVCGREFMPRHKKQKYCSSECRKRDEYARKRALNAQAVV
jgi:hypothetical protein